MVCVMYSAMVVLRSWGVSCLQCVGVIQVNNGNVQLLLDGYILNTDTPEST